MTHEASTTPGDATSLPFRPTGSVPGGPPPSSPVARAAPPARIGPYEVTGHLGEGGMGVVLRGRAPDGRGVAIKLLKGASDPTRLERFHRERKLLQRVDSVGGFVPILDFGEARGAPFIVMPFVTGGTLRARLARGPLPLDEALSIGRAIAESLGRAHALGIIHRDLKPENILFDQDGRPLIADLGLAKHLRQDQWSTSAPGAPSQTGVFAGTFGYGAPEQMGDAKSVGPPADVFSVGAMLHECLSGAPAFHGDNLMELVRKMDRGHHERLDPGVVPPRVVEVVERALSRDPTQRYPDGAALAKALVAATRRSAPSRARPHPAALPIIGALGAVSILAGVWMATSREPAPPPPPSPASPPSPSPEPPRAQPTAPRPGVTSPPPAPRRAVTPRAPRPAVTPLDPDEFKRLFVAQPTRVERRALILRLRPLGATGDESLALLTDFVLKTQDWSLREAAIEVLADHFGELEAELRALAGVRGDPNVVEGIVLAAGLTGDLRRTAFVLEQLGSKKWRVKFAAARALALLGDPVAVEPLIAAWEQEEKAVVAHELRQALGSLLGTPVGGDVAAWRAWYARYGAADVAHRPAPEVVREVVHVVDGVRFQVRLAGRGSFGLFVLPDLGVSAQAVEHGLEDRDGVWRTAHVTLPVREDLGPTASPAPIEYPVERVARALAGLADLLAVDEPAFAKPYGVVASGVAGWVSATHAALHPERVRRQVLVSTWSDREQHLAGIQRLRQQGIDVRDVELERYADARLPGWSPGRQDDEAAALRVRWTSRFFDYRDLRIGELLGPLEEREGRVRAVSERPTDGLALPRFSLSRLERIQTPTLVLTGARDVAVSQEDAAAIARHYGPAGRVVPFPNSVAMPMFEESDKFLEIMQRFTAFKPPTETTEPQPR